MILASRAVRLLCVTTTALAMAACSGGDGGSSTSGPQRSSPPPSTTTGRSASHASASAPGSSSTRSRQAASKPHHLPKVNPLTGHGPEPRSPVIAVKIDDTSPGRPQRGVDRADVVYIEEAEAGLTRLVAVFGTNKPVVGYVRSTRPSDPELLLQYGKITEAASGGGHDALPLLRKSGIRGWINDDGARYYSRVSRYQSSYINLLLNLSRVATKVHTPRPRSIGWRFDARLPTKGTVGTDVRTRVGRQLVEFRWDGHTKQYVRYIDGSPQRAADGRPMATNNVIVQRCRIVNHPQDTDVNGYPAQFTMTKGKGKATVFRNGRRIEGTWRRTRLSGATTLTTASGKALTLMPGNTWVALVRRTAPISGR